MKKLLNLVLTGMLLTVLSFGTAIVADADETNTSSTQVSQGTENGTSCDIGNKRSCL